MPDVAPHEVVTNEEPGINTQPVATDDDVFRNMLADDTEHENSISQLLRGIEGGFLSATHLKKLEIMRKDDKTLLYRGCLVSKLEAYVKLLEMTRIER